MKFAFVLVLLLLISCKVNANDFLCRIVGDFEVCGIPNSEDNSIVINITVDGEVGSTFSLSEFHPESWTNIIIGTDSLTGNFTLYPPGDEDVGVVWANVTTNQYRHGSSVYNAGVIFFDNNYNSFLNYTDVGFVTFRWFFDLNRVQFFIEIDSQLVDAFVLAKDYNDANFGIQIGPPSDLLIANGLVSLSILPNSYWQISANFTYCNTVHGCSSFSNSLVTINPN